MIILITPIIAMLMGRLIARHAIIQGLCAVLNAVDKASSTKERLVFGANLVLGIRKCDALFVGGNASSVLCSQKLECLIIEPGGDESLLGCGSY